jgi:hypothetical protein
MSVSRSPHSQALEEEAIIALEHGDLRRVRARFPALMLETAAPKLHTVHFAELRK